MSGQAAAGCVTVHVVQTPGWVQNPTGPCRRLHASEAQARSLHSYVQESVTALSELGAMEHPAAWPKEVAIVRDSHRDSRVRSRLSCLRHALLHRLPRASMGSLGTVEQLA